MCFIGWIFTYYFFNSNLNNEEMHSVDCSYRWWWGRWRGYCTATHLWPPPVCPGVSPVPWSGGGRSIGILPSLWLLGCLATGPGDWNTPPRWAADRSGQARSPLSRSPVATTALCTDTYWPRRWGGGLRPLWVPPSGSHWSLLWRLRVKMLKNTCRKKRWGRGNV